MRAGIDAGTLAPADPSSVAAGKLAAIEGLALQNMVDETFDARRHWPEFARVIARGLGAH